MLQIRVGLSGRCQGRPPWRTSMRIVVLGALAGLALAAPSLAQGQDPRGTYLSETGDTRVRIARCGVSYCGTIVAVKGDIKDVNNPDPGLRSRALVGVHM